MNSFKGKFQTCSFQTMYTARHMELGKSVGLDPFNRGLVSVVVYECCDDASQLQGIFVSEQVLYIT